MIKNFTTTLPVDFLDKLTLVSREIGIPKNELLVTTFEFWNKQRIQEQIKKSYSSLSDSEKEEFISFSEEGLVDSNDQLAVWEK